MPSPARRPRPADRAAGQLAGPLTVLIASPLEAALVDRIRAVAPARLRVIHEPDLVPSGPYAGGYFGTKPALDAAGVERWLGLLSQADILFDFDWYEPARLRANAPRLAWVQASRSGIGEQLRRLGLDQSGITFCTAAGVHAVPLAEWATFGLLWLAKQVPRLIDQQRRHHWEQFEAGLLAGQTVLVVGVGGVGTEIARQLDALGVTVWGVRRTSREVPEHVTRLVGYEALDSVLGEVDAIVLACPYTAETHHLLDARRLALLRPGATVVNVARGAVIDQPALVAALRSGHLGGAVLDVQEQEPMPADDPLWDAPNVLVSPHRASIVAVENALIVDLFCDNLRRWLDGRPLRNVYEPGRAY